MKHQIAIIVLLFSSPFVNAALQSRYNGSVYYDTVAGISWLRNANSLRSVDITSLFGTYFDGDLVRNNDFEILGGTNFTGKATWRGAMSAINILEFGGVTNWRLPSGLRMGDSTSCVSGGCPNTEMGNLFYNELGNSTGNINSGPFVNIDTIWTKTETSSSSAINYRFQSGLQINEGKNNKYFGWAVTDGDPFAPSYVPLPSVVWLFGSGLIGLVGLHRRKPTVSSI